jgi:uncharacterized protein
MNEYYKKCCLIIFSPDQFHGQELQLSTPEERLRIDGQLVNHTIQITSDFPVTKHLYYNEKISTGDNWNPLLYKKQLLKGDHPGIQMQNAFQAAYNEGFRKVIIIGSNAMGLEKRHLEEAFLSLKIIEFCIGPATNGGYYLLGMNQFEPILFQNKEWDSANLCKSSIRDIGNLKAALYKLPTLITGQL